MLTVTFLTIFGLLGLAVTVAYGLGGLKLARLHREEAEYLREQVRSILHQLTPQQVAAVEWLPVGRVQVELFEQYPGEQRRRQELLDLHSQLESLQAYLRQQASPVYDQFEDVWAELRGDLVRIL